MDHPKPPRLPRYTGLFLFLLGANLLVIGEFGTAMPYFDQWTAEGLRLFLPWLQGRLTVGDMFSAFNEHHVFVPRVLALLLFELNHHVWSVMLQESVNAVLHVITLVVLVGALLPACPPRWRRGFIIASALLLAIPLGWENLLCSFQTQIYGMMLFSLLFIRRLAGAPPLSKGWWLALPWLVLAYLSQAPSVATAGAGALITLAAAREPARRPAALTGAAILLVLALIGFHFTPLMLDTVMRRGFHEATLPQRADGLLTLLAWPVYVVEWLAPLVWLPYFLVAWRAWWRGPEAQEWLPLCIGFWVLVQCAGIAWGRGLVPLEPRYQDILIMGLMVCLVFVLRLLAKTAGSRGAERAALLWAIAIAVGMVMQVLMAHDALVARRLQGEGQLSWIREYVAQDAAGRQRMNDQGRAGYPDAFSPVPFLQQPLLLPLLPGILDDTSARQPAPIRWWLAGLTPLGMLLLAGGTVLLLRRDAGESSA